MGLVLGGVSTADLQAEEIMELQDQYPFSQSEIRRLYRRFKKLDNTRNGVITRAQLLKIPELSMNPLAQRIISLFHPPPDASVTSSSDERRIRDAINFNDFLKMLSVFSESSPVIEKERLAFLLYDIDKDGFISEIIVGLNDDQGIIEIKGDHAELTDENVQFNLSNKQIAKLASSDQLASLK